MPRLSRREALAALGGAALAGCLDEPGRDPAGTTAGETGFPVSATVESPPADGAWPMAKRDAGATAGAPVANGPDGFPLERAWTRRTGQGDMHPAIVADGTLLALTSHPDADLAALDPADGQASWSRTHDRLGHGPPALVGDRAIVPWGYYQSGEYVDALALADGSRDWRTTVAEAPIAVLPVGDTVYVALEANTTVLGLSLEAGEEQYRHRFAEPAFRIRRLAVADGRLFAGIAGMETDYPDVGFVVALDPAAGRLDWRHEASSPIDDLAVTGGTAFAGSGAGLEALDEASGEVEWVANQLHGRAKHVAVRDGTVVAGSFNEVRAFAAASGEQRWRHETGGGRGLAIAGDVAYAAGKADGEDAEWAIVGIDLGSGEIRGRQATDAEPRSLSIADGRLYLGTRDGRLLAFE